MASSRIRTHHYHGYHNSYNGYNNYHNSNTYSHYAFGNGSGGLAVSRPRAASARSSSYRASSSWRHVSTACDRTTTTTTTATSARSRTSSTSSTASQPRKPTKLSEAATGKNVNSAIRKPVKMIKHPLMQVSKTFIQNIFFAEERKMGEQMQKNL